MQLTEQEKRRRRREMERRMRTGAGRNKKTEKKGGLTAFRLYVTTVLVAGCLLISAFHSETSEMVCGKVKEVISMEISKEEMAEWKVKAAAYLKEKEISLPVFLEKETEPTKQEKTVYRPDP